MNQNLKSEGSLNQNLESEGYKNQNWKVMAVWTKILKVRAVWTKIIKSEGYKKQKKRGDNEVLVVPMDRGRPEQLGLGTPLGYPGTQTFFQRFRSTGDGFRDMNWVTNKWGQFEPKLWKWGLYETKLKSEGSLNQNLESEGYKNQNRKVRAVWNKILKVRAIRTKTEKWGQYEPKS